MRSKRRPEAKGFFSYGFGRFAGYRSFGNSNWRHDPEDSMSEVLNTSTRKSVTNSSPTPEIEQLTPKSSFSAWWKARDLPRG